MGTTAVVSLSEYLHSSYEPDAEFVDGRIEERAVGERDHSDLQVQLLLLLSDAECRRYFVVRPELRVQTMTNHFRVPDVCMLRAGAPREPIVVTPPLLCAEILSPEDTMSRTLLKVSEYLQLGVPEVWVIDPDVRIVRVCSASGTTEYTSGKLKVPETPISLSLDELFGVLDES